MKVPRDVSGDDLVKKLIKFEYKISRQKGSHIRLTTFQNGEHHVTIPNHPSLRVGTLSAILSEVAIHHKKTKDEITQILFYE